jgi:hypothetical protein
VGTLGAVFSYRKAKKKEARAEKKKRIDIMKEEEMKSKAEDIDELMFGFCQKHLNDEYFGYARNLLKTICTEVQIDINRGRKEIWAASIIYVIARLNFLFDKENKLFITPDTICDYFKTVKSTTGNKASEIQTVCDLQIGQDGYCSPKIADMFKFYMTPEGFVLPMSALNGREVAVEFKEGEEADKPNARIEEHEKNKMQKKYDKVNVKLGEKPVALDADHEKKYGQQLSLFE